MWKARGQGRVEEGGFGGFAPWTRFGVADAATIFPATIFPATS
jgi:hypothetical protein